jgi:molecular chaperone DnaK (HSP70)
MVFAIDFGTSNTVVARWNRATEQAETVALPGISAKSSPAVIPSLLYVESAATTQLVLGQAVRDRGLDLAQDQRSFRNFKRGIGATGFVPQLDGVAVDFEQVGAWFLGGVLRQLAATETLDALVLTVPVDSFEVYRLWLGQVCANLSRDGLNLPPVQMVDEPTAAALGYGIRDRSTLLVVDFGGGTLDIALVQVQGQGAQPSGWKLWGKAEPSGTPQRPQTARVVAKAGQSLGGADIDNWLLDHFRQTQDLPVSALTLRLAERLKIQLSQQVQAQEAYFNDETFDSYELSLERGEFEQILAQHEFFEQLDGALDQVLQQARRSGLSPSDIDAVLMVGGTCQIPSVQSWIQTSFPADKIRCDRPLEAIAQGALQLGLGTELQDFLYHSYGVRYWDRRVNAHNWHPIIKTGQVYPMPDSVELTLGASTENQPSIELVMGELATESEQTEVFFDGDRLITRRLGATAMRVKPLNDKEGARSIASLTPPGFPGSDRIRVYFRVDADRFLRITVEDILTIQTLIDDQPVVQLS